MKRFTILLSALFFAITLLAQTPKYSKVKVYANELQLAELAGAGIDITEGFMKKGVFLVSDFSETEIEKISSLNLDYEILIDDVVKYYQDRNIGLSANVDDYKDAGDYEVPENFEFGSMSGHATYAEIAANLDNMVSLFPNLITVKESIGQTIEGRDMWMVKISDNPTVNETEPEVLYTALHHAREPVGAMQMMFYIYYLLENYDNDPFIQTLVDNTEMYFIPVVNPDGYVYNQTTNPNGGGMWRKNRRITGTPGCDGIDLNRNYGFMWGYDNSGSSPDPCDETYRGTAAFSEPEIATIRDFCESHEITSALNYHTYGSLLLYAWGYIPDPSPDDNLCHAHATLMTQDNHYTFGPGNTTIYATNGGSDDWMYGEQTTKGKIFAYTPELGNDNDGFWCSIDRIIPIAQENMIQNILLAAFAGSYAHAVDLSPTITGYVSGYLDFDLTRYGLVDGDFTVSLEPLDNWVTSVGDPVEFNGMDILETQSGSISWTLDPAIVNGTQFRFLFSVDNGSYIISDTLNKIYGTPVVLFEDDCNEMTNWTSTSWGLTTQSYHSAPKSITDSPGGNYQNSVTRTITFNSSVELSNAVYAVLNFWTKWEIEAGYDYVQIFVSDDNGSTWTPLTGNYTKTGNENQAEGEPLYDGFQTTWVQEEIDLSEYISTSVKFKFVLTSDWYTTEDGYYFDDFTITIIESPNTGFIEQPSQKYLFISEPVPNPADDIVSFYLDISDEVQGARFIIFNVSGQKVFETGLTTGQKLLSVPVAGLPSGIYHYRIEADKVSSHSKKLIIL